MRAKLVVCDRCGKVVEHLQDAFVFATYDPDGRCVGMGLAHRPCIEQLRTDLECGGARDRESTVVDQPAQPFLDEAEARALRGIARGHWASTSTLLRKVRRLAALEVPRSAPASPEMRCHR